MPKKDNKKVTKNEHASEMEYSQSLNPATGLADNAIGRTNLNTSDAEFSREEANSTNNKVIEAGYDKSLDLELAEIGEDQAEFNDEPTKVTKNNRNNTKK